MGMLETLRGGLNGLRISLRMGHTLVQARMARLIGGSTSVELGRPSYDCRSFRVSMVWNTGVFSNKLVWCDWGLLSDIDMQTHDVDSLTCDGGRVPRCDGVAWGVTSVGGCLG